MEQTRADGGKVCCLQDSPYSKGLWPAGVMGKCVQEVEEKGAPSQAGEVLRSLAGEE